jgi:ubiquinone/menaquinone biosynthesis C-methylase UbiE
MTTSLITEMKGLTPLDIQTLPTPSLDVSLIIPARNSAQTLETTVQEARSFLKSRFQNSFEIILVPNPAPNDHQDESTLVAESLAKKYPEVRVCPHYFPRGKGAAVRTGFQSARGNLIFFTDADLPYDLDFFDRALEKLHNGYDFVTGNRRLPTSHFDIPVELLRIAYSRHRLGLGFNRLVRWFLPLQTTDTQAGIKAMSRRLAVEAFSRQSCPGFLFDLEIFLTAYGQGYDHIHLPVTLHLNSEKSTVRILRECVLVANWLTRIAWKHFNHSYGNSMKKKNRILSRYKSAPLSTRFFLTARWKLTPYSRMAAHLPTQGEILDLGCGHGLFALAAALHSPSRKVLGIDHDTKRIELAHTAVADLSNIQVRTGSMLQISEEKNNFSGISMIDVMHYFEPQAQETLIKKAYELLPPGGKLLVREVDPEGGFASRWNRLYEKIATKIGFTRSDETQLYFRSKSGWVDLLEKVGFQVQPEKCSSFLFADILYVCERPEQRY